VKSRQQSRAAKAVKTLQQLTRGVELDVADDPEYVVLKVLWELINDVFFSSLAHFCMNSITRYSKK
jgi:hypothetical protein